LRLRFEDGVGAVPAVVLPAGWQTAQDDSARGPEAWRELSAGGAYSAVAVVRPSRVRIERTPHREPDTATITIPWAVLPIDPRVVRALGVEVFAAAITPAERAAAERTGALPFELTRKTRRFVGTVRPFAVEPRREIELSASDFTLLLVEAKPTPAQIAALDLSKSIVEAVQTLVSQLPATRGMRVWWVGDTAAPLSAESGAVRWRAVSRVVDTQPTPNAVASSPPAVLAAGVPADGRATEAGRVPYLPVEPDTSAWDVITDLTTQCGCVAWVSGDAVFLGPARTVFAGGAARRFVDARNLSRLRFARDLGRRSIPAVEVRCWSAAQRRVLVDRYPATAAATTEDVIRTVAGVESVAGLAEPLYHELRRQRMDGGFDTADVSALDSDGGELLGLHPGDALDVSPALAVFDAGDLRALPAAEVQARLEAAGVSAPVAEALAGALTAGRLTTYWTQRVSLSWSAGQGTTLSVAFAELPTITDARPGRILVAAR